VYDGREELNNPCRCDGFPSGEDRRFFHVWEDLMPTAAEIANSLAIPQECRESECVVEIVANELQGGINVQHNQVSASFDSAGRDPEDPDAGGGTARVAAWLVATHATEFPAEEPASEPADDEPIVNGQTQTVNGTATHVNGNTFTALKDPETVNDGTQEEASE
jgi:hypothetical protein